MEVFYKNLNLTSVSISGGGTYGLTMLHLLDSLRTMGAFNKVQHWHGTSIGSVCALCMNLQLRPQDIQPKLKHIEEQFKITPQSILSIPDTYGMIHHEPLKKLIGEVLETIGIFPHVTFQQLFRITKQTLSVFACDININKLICFNHRHSPTIQVVDAILASCSIPIVFPVYKINSRSFIDGCFLSDWAIDEENSDLKHTLLIKTSFNPPTQSQPINNCVDYVSYLIYTGGQNIQRIEPRMQSIMKDIKCILNIPFTTTSFNLSNLHLPEKDIKQKVNDILVGEYSKDS